MTVVQQSLWKHACRSAAESTALEMKIQSSAGLLVGKTCVSVHVCACACLCAGKLMPCCHCGLDADLYMHTD